MIAKLVKEGRCLLLVDHRKQGSEIKGLIGDFNYINQPSQASLISKFGQTTTGAFPVPS